MAECKVANVFNKVSGRWTLAILRQIEIGKRRRFTALMGELKGISARTLSKRLDELEKIGVILRESYSEIPPRVEYSLTPKGRKLVACFEKLEGWAEEFEER